MAFSLDFVPTKRRPRVARATGAVYDPEANRREAREIAAAYGGPLLEGAVGVRVDVYPRLPASAPKGTMQQAWLKKPDVDNVAKAVMDALSGTAYADDRQVVELHVRRHDATRAACARTVVDVYAAGEGRDGAGTA